MVRNHDIVNPPWERACSRMVCVTAKFFPDSGAMRLHPGYGYFSLSPGTGLNIAHIFPCYLKELL